MGVASSVCWWHPVPYSHFFRINWCSGAIYCVGLWVRACWLKANPDNSEIMLTECRKQPVETYPHSFFKGYAPILLHPQLFPGVPISADVKSVSYLLHTAERLHHSLSEADLAKVTHALSSRWLDYCKALYVGLYVYHFQKLQLLQNAAAQSFSGVSH